MARKTLICGAVGAVVVGGMHWMGIDLIALLVVSTLAMIVVATMVIHRNPNDISDISHDNSSGDRISTRSSVDSAD